MLGNCCEGGGAAVDHAAPLLRVAGLGIGVHDGGTGDGSEDDPVSAFEGEKTD